MVKRESFQMSEELLNFYLGSGAENEGEHDTKPGVESPAAERAADGPEAGARADTHGDPSGSELSAHRLSPRGAGKLPRPLGGGGWFPLSRLSERETEARHPSFDAARESRMLCGPRRDSRRRSTKRRRSTPS